MMTRKRLKATESCSVNEGQEGIKYCSQESGCQLKSGDIAWIKIHGDSWWPALVVNENTVSVKHNKKAETDILVRMYGTYEYSFVDPVQCSGFEYDLKQENRTMRETFQKALEEDLYRLKSGGKPKNKLSGPKGESARTEDFIGKRQTCDEMKRNQETDDSAFPMGCLRKWKEAKTIENEEVDRARNEAPRNATVKRYETRKAKNKNNTIGEASQRMLDEEFPIVVSSGNSKRKQSESAESAAPVVSEGKRQKQDRMRNSEEDCPASPGVDAIGDAKREGVEGIKKKEGTPSSESRKVKANRKTEGQASREKMNKQSEASVPKSGPNISNEATRRITRSGNGLKRLEVTEKVEAGTPEANISSEATRRITRSGNGLKRLEVTEKVKVGTPEANILNEATRRIIRSGNGLKRLEVTEKVESGTPEANIWNEATRRITRSENGLKRLEVTEKLESGSPEAICKSTVVKPKGKAKGKASRKKTTMQDEASVSKSGSKISNEATRKITRSRNHLEKLKKTGTLDDGTPEAKSMRRYERRNKKEIVEIKETGHKSSEASGIRNSKVGKQAKNETPEVNSIKQGISGKLELKDCKENSKPERLVFVKGVMLDVDISARRKRVMQSLGLVAPAGSPY